MDNEPIKILLADDDENDRLTFKEALEELKIKTTYHALNDGVQLMDYLLNLDSPLPALLFLDLNMPRKSGLECLQEIRNIERFKNVIIVIYSTSSHKKDVEATFLNGANVYIKKPNDFNTLIQTLDKVVRSAYLYQHPPFNVENFMLQL